jgi:hypothetical protein
MGHPGTVVRTGTATARFLPELILNRDFLEH